MLGAGHVLLGQLEPRGARDGVAAVAGAERLRRALVEEDVLERGDDPRGGVTVAVGVLGDAISS